VPPSPLQWRFPLAPASFEGCWGGRLGRRVVIGTAGGGEERHGEGEGKEEEPELPQVVMPGSIE